MSENSNSANGNSWTLLATEEPGVENMGPVTEGMKVEGQLSKASEPSTEACSDLKKHSFEASAHHPETDTSAPFQSDPAQPSEKTHETQVTSKETSEGRAQLNAAHANEDCSSVGVEDISSCTTDHEEQDALTGHSESPVCPAADADSFSDTFTHISPTSGASPPPASVCKEKDWFKSDEETTGGEPKEVLEINRKEGDGLRKRNISHLGSLDKTEAEDDEEREEEDFQPPRREEETVFSLNKCILAAVILLGLGTIFFSGVLMDPDGEADMDVRELKDPANQEWMNPEVSRDTPVGLQSADISSKYTKADQQILALKAQLQQHEGELKAVQLLAEAGEKERVRREELEKDYQRIKGELDRLPALQKELEQENERIKEESTRAKKELEVLPSLQSELEYLRAKVSQLTGKSEPPHSIAASRTPSAGGKRDVPPIERQDMKPRKTWDKKTEEKERSKADKEWKKKKGGKKEGDKDRGGERVTDSERTKEQKGWKKEERKAGKQKEEQKEWKKDKKRDDGKIGKESEDKWGEKKDKKGKKDKLVGNDEKRENKKDWKDAGNKKVKEEKERKQKDWRSDKHSDHTEWKEKKKDEWKGKKEKSEGKHNEKKRKGDREEYAGKEKEQKGRKRGKESEWTRDGLKEEKKNKAHQPKHQLKISPYEKEKRHKEKHRNTPPEETSTHQHHEQQNYWTRQRERIQHYDNQRDQCSSVEDCARVEGLSPVHLQDFEKLLQSYMNKLQEEQNTKKEELRKLVREFFNDGVFAHDQMPFSDFVEDVGDILEDMADGEESDTEVEDSEEDDDDEMEEFEREAMEKFALPLEARKGEQKKESGRLKV